MTEELNRDRIRFRRGEEKDLPLLDLGEPGVATDTKRVFVGTGAKNIELAQSKDGDAILDFSRRPLFNSVMLADLYPEGKVTRFIFSNDEQTDVGFPVYSGMVETYRPIGAKARQVLYEEYSYDLYSRYELDNGWWSPWKALTYDESYSEV